MVEEASKLEWVASRLQSWIDQGDVLLFASRREQVDILTDKLKARGFRSAAPLLHGFNQYDWSMHLFP